MSDWSNMTPPEALQLVAQPWPYPPPITPQPISATVDAAVIESMRKRLTIENLPLSGDGILMLWERTKTILTNAKNDEMSIRKVAVKVFVPQPREGINTVDLGGGYQLKAGVNFSYTLDSDINKVSEIHAQIATYGNYGHIIAPKIFKFSADLVLSEYRLLEEDASTYPEIAAIKKLVDSVLTKTDKAPTLDIKEPKKK